MAENPPLNRLYVAGYAANDRDYPIVSMNLDPRVAGYKVPEDLSTCPDKRYPNHVFTGAQPISGDERVRHVWEILPSPYAPFTRYDDDLGPVQGRRRSVKNDGQVASREADKQVTYDAREGSAIVYTELEETWSIKTDEDGNSLFPIRDRDFYDPSRGPVQERRQLFVPTGEEEGSLEDVNGVITQTSHEPYNEFLSVKIVQTYKVDGPQLIGKATDNDGQLITVTTQRKGALNYIPPNPTATRTVEVSREDAESLVERIVDTPEIFKANTFSVERPDPIPQKFRVAVPIQSSQEIVEGTAETPTLEEGEISKSEEQRNKFIKRVSSTSRDQDVLPQTLTGKTTNNERQDVTVTETLQLGNTNEVSTATTTIESEALGDGNYVITKTQVAEVFGAEVFRKVKDDLTPQKFRGAQEESTTEENIEGVASDNITLATGEFVKSEQQINKFVKRVSTTSRTIDETAILSESVLTPEGLRATRTLTLANGSQSFTPSATLVDANVEVLGDGRTVKTEVVIPKVFSGKTISKTKADLTPQKFRSAQEDTTTEEALVGEVTEPSLGENEFSKSEQQVTEFVKRVTTNVRDIETSTTLEEKVVTPDGQLATRTLRLSKEAQTIEPDELTVDGSIEALGDGRTIKTETKAPSVLELPVFSIERPDATPAKFRVAAPTTTEQKTIVGDAEQPILEEGDISKSEQQQTKFVKRTIVTKRDQDQLPKTLTQKTTTNEGLLATVKETLKVGDATEQPNATRTVESEALGDGNYVVRITEVPRVFSGKTFSIEKPEIFPSKFRASIPSITTQETVEGDATQPTISTNEISKSEQQVTKFVKRVSVASREETKLPVELIQRATNQEKQLVTITETLQQGNTQEQPSSKIDIKSEAIGDGKYIVTKTQTPEVFKATTFRAEKADLTPQKFRAKQVDTTTEETIEGNAEIPSLGDNEFSKTEQQVNKFVKRISKTERETEVTEFLEEKVITPEGQLATRTITLSKDDQTITPSATVIDGNIEQLGDGRTVKTEISVGAPFDSRQESLEKPEIIPPEFRASLQNRTVSVVKSGESIEIPSLSQDEVSKTIQRLTEHKIRETVTKRPIVGYPALSGQLIDNDLIRVNRTRTVTKGSQQITPNATTSGTVESLGDGYTLKTEDVKAKLFAANVFSIERPDNIPVEFRVEKPASTEEYNKEGKAEGVNLNDTEISKSEQQVNEFVKRVRTTTREDVGGVILSEEQVDQDGVKASVIRTLAKGTQTISPSEIVRGQVQNLGGGYTVKTEITRGEVLKLPSFSVEKPDVVPAAFRAKVKTTTREETVAGDAEQPSLVGGEISKTERQIDKFLKRKTTTSRPETVSGELFGEEVDNDGIKASVIRTLSGGFQQISPSATVSGNVEDIGDGLSIKTEITKAKVFEASVLSAERLDMVPAKFRAKIPTKTKQSNSEGLAVQPTLGGAESDTLSKTEQQVTEFVKKVTTVSRNFEGSSSITGSKVYTSELGGGTAEIEETFSNSLQSITPKLGTVSSEVENIGNDLFVKREVTLPIPLPILKGQTYDDTLDISIPYTRQFIAAGTEEVGQPSSIDPRDTLHSIATRIDYLNARTRLLEVFYKTATIESVSLPDRLVSASLRVNHDSSGENSTGSGKSGSASVSVSVSTDAALVYQIEDGYSGFVDGESYLFFLPKEECTISNVLGKIGGDVEKWPLVRPKSHRVYVSIKSERKGGGVTLSLPNNTSISRSASVSTSIKSLALPPTLHGQINLSPIVVGETTKSATATVSGGDRSGTASETATGAASVISTSDISPTSPESFPTGKFLYRLETTPYKFGLVRINAVVVEIEGSMV